MPVRNQSARFGFMLLGILAALVQNNSAQAALTLTPYALAHPAGPFSLTTFATGFPNAVSVGPLGVAYVHVDPNIEKVMVSDYADGKVYTFPSHSSNQVAGPGLVTATYPDGADQIDGMAQIQVATGWQYYATQQTPGHVIQVDANGQLVRVVANIPGAIGIVPYPAGLVNGHTGHLFVSDGGYGHLWEIDPSTNSATAFESGLDYPDGLSISADGNTIYAAMLQGGVAKGFDLATGANTWTSPGISAPDGMATGTGNLTGFLYVNTNAGELWEFGVPPHVATANLIASGGSRGDFIACDGNAFCAAGHPSLLITQTDRILRLDPPGGGWFGPPASTTAPVVTGPAPLPTLYTLGVTVAGSGSVAKNPDLPTYLPGSVVTLTAAPAGGSSFLNWSGDASGPTLSVSITMSGNKAVTATFFTAGPLPGKLTVTTKGGGTISKSPDLATYPAGTVVQLSAASNAGYAFLGWFGDATGNTNPTSITIDGDKYVLAEFTRTVPAVNTFGIILLCLLGLSTGGWILWRRRTSPGE